MGHSTDTCWSSGVGFSISLVHPSIQALLAAEGGDDPLVAIQRRARKFVTKAMKLGWIGPPFDLRKLARMRGYSVETSTQFDEDHDACILPGRILVNARRSPVRQRYSVAHEMIHTLFPDYKQKLKREGRLWRRQADDSELEQLCQTAAAEVLMPYAPFQERAETYGRDMEGLLRLAKDFDSSVEATARRLVGTANESMVALFLRPVDVTGAWLNVEDADQHDAHAPIIVSRVCASSACVDFDAVSGTAPPARGSAERAWKRAALAHGAIKIESSAEESWEHSGVPGHWMSESITLPKGNAVPREVLCLLRSQPRSTLVDVL